ncbi:MAG TPA: hemerythrin domain-containing protein [Ornithinibacter sp.]|nr:hemerythrin domain-containing protein [Ornithinibacter sp.]
MTGSVTLPNDADAQAVSAVQGHHATMAHNLASLVERLVVTAVDGRDGARARDELVHWCRDHLVPHALAEEKAMYPAAHATVEGRLLVDGMLAEHAVIVGLVDEVEHADHDVRAAAAGTALVTMFRSHLAKENDLVLPLLAGSPDVSVAELLEGMHELLGGDADDHDADHSHGHGASHTH